jgi:hypothetical protein
MLYCFVTSMLASTLLPASMLLTSMMLFARMPLASMLGRLDIWLLGPFDACLDATRACFDDADCSDVCLLGHMPLKYLVPWMLAWMFMLALMLLPSMMLLARLLASIFGRLDDNWMFSQSDARLDVSLDAADRSDGRSLDIWSFGQVDGYLLRCSLRYFCGASLEYSLAAILGRLDN